MSKGWIALHRSIWDNDLWKEIEPFDKRSAWIDLLLMANHESNSVKVGMQVVQIERGQLFTSVRKLADRWHWNRPKVERYLDFLCETRMLTKCATQNGTLLTIVNYGIYQGLRDTNVATNRDTNVTQTINKTNKTRYTRSGSKSKIHNFSERKTDYEQLERKLTQ